MATISAIILLLQDEDVLLTEIGSWALSDSHLNDGDSLFSHREKKNLAQYNEACLHFLSLPPFLSFASLPLFICPCKYFFHVYFLATVCVPGIYSSEQYRCWSHVIELTFYKEKRKRQITDKYTIMNKIISETINALRRARGRSSRQRDQPGRNL